ncbi:MAG: hypothetical protein QOE54_6151 [Streptosporangiaceae bacterium]|nr:hypothetical protein [Streptosporangiaceae bacterium]MDX6433785.1 hypothetical protein [Streptosporangiaceae bacterium]
MPYGEQMLIATTDGLAGYDITAYLGEVFAVAVHTGPVSAPGGQSSGTFRMPDEGQSAQSPGLTQTRRDAVERLKAEAQRKGANAVVGMRFDNGPVAGSGHEVCAYGTAVWATSLAEAANRPAESAAQRPYQQQPGFPQSTPQPMAARNLTVGLPSQRGDRHT